WAVPFILRSPYMGGVGWRYYLSLDLFAPAPVLAVIPWTIAGSVALWRSGVRPGVLAVFGIAAALSYFLPHTLFAQQRGLPIAHLCVYLLTGIGVAAGLARAFEDGRRLHLTLWTAGIVALFAVCALQVDGVRARSDMLLTSNTPDSESYDDLARTLG